MASPNTLKLKDKFASLQPHPIVAISKKDKKPCGFRNGLPQVLQSGIVVTRGERRRGKRITAEKLIRQQLRENADIEKRRQYRAHQEGLKRKAKRCAVKRALIRGRRARAKEIEVL